MMGLSLSQVINVAESRPLADHRVEQYLMTPESLYHQLGRVLPNIDHHGTILLLGDDDHLSIFLAQHVSGRVVVVENDRRIITNLSRLKAAHNLDNLQIVAHDIRKPLRKIYDGKFDYCIFNPPYSSKNDGFGIRVWLSRALTALKVNGAGLLILPINQSLDWSMKNYLMVQRFLADLHMPILDIDRNVHTYEDLPDQGLLSSNIWFVKLENISVNSEVLGVIHKGKSLYR